MEAPKKIRPRLVIEPDRKLTPEQEMTFIASSKVDFLIRSMGSTAEVLDMQNRKLSGKSLRDSLMEAEVQKLRDAAEAKRLRVQERKMRQKEREAAAEKDIVENWEEHYILSIDGKRVKKIKKLETVCPFCGEPHTRPRGALIELYEWRRNHQDAPSPYINGPPIRSESVRCGKCGRSFSFTAQLII